VLGLISAGVALWRFRAVSTPSETAQLAQAAPVTQTPTGSAAPIRENAQEPGQEDSPSSAPAADPWESTEPKPTLGLPPPHARKSYDTREASPEELEKLGPQLQKYRDAWQQHLEPLLYPEGHPQEGQYRDNVCLEQAVEAQLDYYEAVSPSGSMEQPRLHVRRHIAYEVARDAQVDWNQNDLASTRRLYDKLIAAPEDPSAPLSDIWLPAAPGDPEATSRREFLEDRLRRREAPIFQQRGCSDAG
jgi:hypothetical protein